MSVKNPAASWRASPILGIVLLVTGLGSLSLQDVFMKTLTAQYSAFELLAIRSCFSLLVLAVVLLVVRHSPPLATRQLAMQLLRGTTLFCALACFYTALSVMPLFDVVTIFLTAPIIATALAALLLKERVSLACWIAVAVGFAGALLMVRPSDGIIQTASSIALAAALFYALALILSRRLGMTEPAATTAYFSAYCYLFWSLIGVVVVEVVFGYREQDPGSPLLKLWAAPTLLHLAYLALGGLMVAVGFFCMAAAYARATVTVLAPFEYTGMIWSGLLAYVAWNEVPSPMAWIGAGMIFASGILVARWAVPSTNSESATRLRR